MVPSTAGSPSHGGMKKLHIHSGANTHYTYTHIPNGSTIANPE